MADHGYATARAGTFGNIGNGLEWAGRALQGKFGELVRKGGRIGGSHRGEGGKREGDSLKAKVPPNAFPLC